MNQLGGQGQPPKNTSSYTYVDNNITIKKTEKHNYNSSSSVCSRKKKTKKYKFCHCDAIDFSNNKAKNVLFHKGFLCVSFYVIFRITSFIFYPMEFIKKKHHVEIFLL